MKRRGSTIYSNDMHSSIGFNRVADTAWKASDVWRLGVKVFQCDCSLIFRINYLRTKKHTHYFQISIKNRSPYRECAN